MKVSKRKSAAWWAMVIGCLVLGFLAALQMKNLIQLRALNLYGNNDIEALQDQIQGLNLANNELKQRNDALNQNLQELAQAGNADDAQLNFYRSEISRLSIYAGLTDVKGPGAIISIATASPEAYVDAASLLVIVNSLRANGVYAISINGQRVVALTEISPTGSGPRQNIVKNGTNITSPDGYEIRVIGEPQKLQDFYAIQSGIWNNLRAQGCTIQINYPEEIQIPALPKDSPAYRQNLLETVDTD